MNGTQWSPTRKSARCCRETEKRTHFVPAHQSGTESVLSSPGHSPRPGGRDWLTTPVEGRAKALPVTPRDREALTGSPPVHYWVDHTQGGIFQHTRALPVPRPGPRGCQRARTSVRHHVERAPRSPRGARATLVGMARECHRFVTLSPFYPPLQPRAGTQTATREMRASRFCLPPTAWRRQVTPAASRRSRRGSTARGVR